MTFTCINCKSKLSQNDIFCPQCGVKNEKLAKINKRLFWIPFVMIIFAYIMAIAVLFIIGISVIDYWREKSIANPWFQTKNILMNFFTKYLFVFIFILLIFFNNKKKNKKIAIINLASSIFLVVFTILIILIDFFILLRFRPVYNIVFMAIYEKIKSPLIFVLPHSFLGHSIYLLINTCSWQIDILKIINGIIYLSSIILYFRYCLKEFKEIK